jgi:hypothetical protein
MLNNELSLFGVFQWMAMPHAVYLNLGVSLCNGLIADRLKLSYL